MPLSQAKKRKKQASVTEARRAKKKQRIVKAAAEKQMQEIVSRKALFASADHKMKKASDSAELRASQLRSDHFLMLHPRIPMRLVFQPPKNFRVRDASEGRIRSIVLKMKQNRFTRTFPLVLQMMVLPQEVNANTYDPEHPYDYVVLDKATRLTVLQAGFNSPSIHELVRDQRIVFWALGGNTFNTAVKKFKAESPESFPEVLEVHSADVYFGLDASDCLYIGTEHNDVMSNFMRPTTFHKLEAGRKYALQWKKTHPQWTKGSQTRPPSSLDEVAFLEEFPNRIDDNMRDEIMTLLGKPLPPKPETDDRQVISRWMNKIRNTYYLVRAMCAPQDEFDLMAKIQAQGAKAAAEDLERTAKKKSIREGAHIQYQDPDIITNTFLQGLYGSQVTKEIKLRALNHLYHGKLKLGGFKKWVASQMRTNMILTKILAMNKAQSIEELQQLYGPEFTVEYISGHLATAVSIKELKKGSGDLPEGVLDHLTKLKEDYKVSAASIRLQVRAKELNDDETVELLSSMTQLFRVQLRLPITFKVHSAEMKRDDKRLKDDYRFKPYHTWCVYDKDVDLRQRLDDEQLARCIPLVAMNKSLAVGGIFPASFFFINPPWGHKQAYWDDRAWTEAEWANCFLNMSGTFVCIFAY